MTEQGETIAARYGRREIARRDLEQMVGAVLLGSPPERLASDDAGARRAGCEAMLDRAARVSHDAYGLLLEDPRRLARYALAATPLREVAEIPIASRPAGRRGGLSFEELRAIPWVFSWNQSRHGLPGWFGLGAGLDALVREHGLDRVRALYAEWPVFSALIDNAQIALVRSDIDVAGHYARLADEDARSLYGVIRREHERTVARVLETTGRAALLEAWPTVFRTVERRNPYVDVLSHVQIELLRRLLAEPPEVERIRAALFVTINGIAAGLQTAG